MKSLQLSDPPTNLWQRVRTANVPPPVAEILLPKSCPNGNRDLGSPSSTECSSTQRPSAEIAFDGSVAMDCNSASVDRLAVGAHHRKAGNDHRLASARISSVLDLEESPSCWPSLTES